MRKPALGALTAFLLLATLRSDAFGGWLIYHKPAYEGKVVDVETNEPIEGAVVTSVYSKHVFTYTGSHNQEIHVAEALTDAKGYFKIPSFTKLMGPLSGEEPVHFIIFKSGYAAADGQSVLEEIFRNKPPYYSEHPWRSGRHDILIRFAPGIIALPKLKTKPDRQSNINRIQSPSEIKAVLLERKMEEELRIIGGINR
jgi:hypothetical protein